jgi:RNA polymerase sigma-70 factor (sigma-E family)
LGTDDEFAAYAAARWGALVRSALFLGCDREEAEDVVQATLVDCYRHWTRVQKADRVDAYVHRILVNRFRKSRRRHRRHEVATDPIPDTGVVDCGAESDARTDLDRVLKRLSVDHRTVLVLRFVADLTEQQVADVLGIPVGTVKSRVSRGLAAIDTAALREERQ